MEDIACNVIYVDRSVSRDRHVRAGEQDNDKDAAQWESAHIAENVKLLRDVFDEGICASPLRLVASVVTMLGGIADYRP